MTSHLRRGGVAHLVLAMLLGSAGGASAAAGSDTIVVTTTIQAAVNQAGPGDTVLVPPGVYRETVTIVSSAITIRGSRGAILDASGFAVGIRAASGPMTGGPGEIRRCPVARLTDLAVEGLRVTNASFTGVLFRGVDGFSITDGVYVGNGGAYALFPICSTRGLISGNQVEGTDDGAIYVGVSRDITVEDNHATASTVGIEIENSTGLVVRHNRVSGNTAGIAIFALPLLDIPVVEGILVERNVVIRNNRPNPFLPTEEAVGALPTGSGIIALGADRVSIRDNQIIGNDSGGLAVLASPLAAIDPRMDAFPDDVGVIGNVVRRNGLDPDPIRSPVPGADLIYDGSGRDVCFADNVAGTEFPVGLTAAFPCQ